MQYNVCSDTNSWAFHNADPAVSAIGTECTVDYIEILGIAYTCESTQLNTRLCGPVFHIYKGATVANGNAMSLCGMNFLPKMPNRVSFLMIQFHIHPSLDCTRPFTVQFVSNAAGIALTPAAIATHPQRGSNKSKYISRFGHLIVNVLFQVFVWNILKLDAVGKEVLHGNLKN